MSASLIETRYALWNLLFQKHLKKDLSFSPGSVPVDPLLSPCESSDGRKSTAVHVYERKQTKLCYLYLILFMTLEQLELEMLMRVEQVFK